MLLSINSLADKRVNIGTLTVRPVAAAGFLPTDVAGLDVWLQGDASARTDGALASNWVNQIDAARSATNANTSHWGYWTNDAGFGSKPTVLFDSSAKSLLGTRTVSTNITVFVYARTNGSYNYILAPCATEYNNNFAFSDADAFQWRNNYSTVNGINLGVPRPYIFRLGYLTNGVIGTSDGTSKWSSMFDPDDEYATATGYGLNAKTSSADGSGSLMSVSDVLIYTNFVSDADINRIGNYLCTNHGQTWTNK